MGKTVSVAGARTTDREALENRDSITGEAPALTGRVVVIVNPATHGDAPAIVELLRRRAPADLNLDVRFTPAAGTTTELTRDALETETNAVVAVGGDGTVAQVAAAALHTAIPVGIIPAGSTNITALEAGIPADHGEAVSLLFGPHQYLTSDVGLCGDIPFLHMAGAGMDSQLFKDSIPAIKQRIGWLAYIPPVLHHLFDTPAHFTLNIDGTPVSIDTHMVLVANGSSIVNPHLSLFPGIRSDDGWLDVLSFTPNTPGQVLSVFHRAITHQLAACPYVMHFRARHIVLASNPPLPVELDGDVVAQTPVVLTIAPGAVRFIVPRN